MSRIGQKAIAIPEGVKVEQQGLEVRVSGPLDELTMRCHPRIKVEIDNAQKQVRLSNEHPDTARGKPLHGTMRALIANMITGVSRGFEKKMKIYGTGYSVKEQAGKLILQVGYCHLVEMPIPEGVKVNIEAGATRGNDVPARFSVLGADKCVVGQFAAEIRKVRPPEPYKGKGIRYADEQVRRKVGKAFASGAA